ncbi:MAG TPA: class I SAM-dependent rRNA methyltransferase [Planctomycetaceae bacterium]
MPRPDRPRPAGRKPVYAAIREAYGMSPRDRPPLSRERLGDRSLEPPEELPTIELKSPSWHPHLFRKRLGAWDQRASHGDLVRVALPGGETFGYGLFNPRSEITVRLLSRGDAVPDAAWWRGRLAAAASLRRDLLNLDAVTDAYRLVHAEADGLSGLVVDRFGPVLSAEVFGLGMWQRRKTVLGLLRDLVGTEHVLVRPGPRTAEQEGFEAGTEFSADCPERVVVTEHGVRLHVDFASGHKTGFFCDQRDNRRLVAAFAQGRETLDLCCYTGGFSLAARLAGASAVTGVDLDEMAVAVAKRNAKLNRADVRFVHADVFPYMRDLHRNGRTFGLVVLDPPKLIASRDEFEEGRKRYFDLNRLALPLVAPGGLMLTCSCSGLMPPDEFQKTVSAAAPPGRRVQILETRGAAPDHPVGTDCPDTAYLKALWLRVE